MTSQEEAVHGPSACDRFFSIHELFTLVLHHCDTLALVKAQRVCRLWENTIKRTNIVQEHLFLRPVVNDGSVTPRLNPILTECFGPIFEPFEMDEFYWEWYDYSSLESLPWARDGTTLDAKMRKAYARPDASWRKMLVCQPPIYRADWWHDWEGPELENEADTHHVGCAHQDLNDCAVTIGLLWDFVEARLRRRCEVQVRFFPHGQDPNYDRTAQDDEKFWWRNREGLHSNPFRTPTQLRGFTATIPRVKIKTRQQLDHDPTQDERFNMDTNKWEPMGRSASRDPDPYENLITDCYSDSDRVDKIQENPGGMRWSMSEAFSIANFIEERNTG